MALFGGHRDASLFRHVNKELINDIIDTEIYYYKVIIDESNINLYGEGKDKVYYNPLKIEHCEEVLHEVSDLYSILELPLRK